MPDPSCKRPRQTTSCEARRPAATACSSLHLLGLPSFGNHKGGESDQHACFVQEIGSHFCHTIPYKKGILIGFIPDLHENDIVFSENRFWLTYRLGAQLLEYR
jgi:hypothetical protein